MKSENLSIVTIGCSDLTEFFAGRGYTVTDFADESEVLPSSKLGIPRAFVIRSTAIKTKATEACVEDLRKIWPIVDIIVWAPRCSGDLVLGVMKAGAKDVVLKDSRDELINAVDRVVHGQQILPRVTSKSKKRRAFQFEGIVSRDPKMWDIFDNITQIAATEAGVLVLGETGTGKELVARAIHKLSKRSGRFVAVNCAAIPENLIDSELFGHVKGAFTGASTEKRGLFRHANGGSIFLDEIGHMPLSSQYHLLRVLQENTVRPVGGHEEIPIDVRVIAATSTPLEEFVANGKFREDLLYRLDVMRIVLPPLRDRGEDIIFLFAHFVQKFSKQYKLAFPKMTESFLDELTKYPWPGNVRQLSNISERLVLSQPGEKFTVKDLRKTLKPFLSPGEVIHPESSDMNSANELRIDMNKPMMDAIKPIIASAEKAYLFTLLRECKGRIGVTAEKAGISRRTVLRKLNEWGVDKKDFSN